MSPRMTFWLTSRAALEELASMRLRDVATRVGWSLVTERGHLDEPLLSAAGTDLWFFEDEARGRTLAEMPDATVGALMEASCDDAKQLIDALAGLPWPGIIEAQHGYRRWWLGSLAATVERDGMREALREELEHLARLAIVLESGLPWFDDLAEQLGERDPRSGPILRVPNIDEVTLVELDPARLTRLVAWASDVEHFDGRAWGTLGAAVGSPEWNEYVRLHVRLLRETPGFDRVIVSM